MPNWSYSSTRELHGKHGEFQGRLRLLQAGVTTDENGRAYTNPAAQAEWFAEQIRAMEAELAQRPPFAPSSEGQEAPSIGGAFLIHGCSSAYVFGFWP